MRLWIDKLDTAFGLLKWGTPNPLSGRYARGTCYLICKGSAGEERLRIPIDGKWCDGNCLLIVNECAKAVCMELQTDRITACACNYFSTLFCHDIHPKINIRTRKIIVAFYQAFIERFVISRIMSYIDNFDCNLWAYARSSIPNKPLEEVMSYYNRIIFPDVLVDSTFHPFPENTKWNSIKCRARLGMVYESGQIAGIKDGELFRDAYSAIGSFLNRPISFGCRVDLFPPTPTSSSSGKHPSFGMCITDAKWFNATDISDNAFLGNCIQKAQKALNEKVLPRFGSGSADPNKDWIHTSESWLTDMTMRKPAIQTGMGVLDCDDKAPLFSAFIDSLNHLGLGKSIKEGIIKTFKSKLLKTRYGDPSGDFAACFCGEFDDYCNNPSLAQVLLWHENESLCSYKFSAETLGYALNILGSFGQNTYRFKINKHPYFQKEELTAHKYVTIKPHFIMTDAQGIKIDGRGFNPYEENLAGTFGVGDDYCDFYQCVNRNTFYSCNIGVVAKTAIRILYPWVGGRKILYQAEPYYGCDCLSCSCWNLTDLICAGFGYKVFQEISQTDGAFVTSGDFSWNARCKNCDVKIKKRGAACDPNLECNIFTSRYPARSIIYSHLINFLKSIDAVWILQDTMQKVDGNAIRQVAMVNGELCKEVLCDIPLSYWECHKSYIDLFVQRIANLADAYVKRSLHFVSAGFDDRVFPNNNRNRGCLLLSSVRIPTSFPIDIKDIFCKGDNSLMDARSKNDFRAYFLCKCNYVKRGLDSFAVLFGASRTIKAITARDIETGFTICFSPAIVCFECKKDGEKYIGYMLDDNWRIIGKVPVCFGKWEPFTLREEHRITLGDAFGVVSWDFKVVKRLDA